MVQAGTELLGPLKTMLCDGNVMTIPQVDLIADIGGSRGMGAAWTIVFRDHDFVHNHCKQGVDNPPM